MDGEDPQINYEIIEENINKLSKKVQETNPSVLTFLNDPYCLPSFHDPPPGIKEYTKNHLLELLSISLSPDLDTKTIRAFYHFCFNDNPASFKPIIENGFFNNVSEVIIQNCINNLKNHKLESYTSDQKYHLDNMSNSVLGRISSLTFNCFYNCPKESIEGINFLPKLLNFCYIPSVSSLFEKILSHNPQFSEVQIWLVKKVEIHHEIAKIIISYENDKKEINKADIKDNLFDDDYSFNITAMYKLLSYGLVSPIMSNYFCSEICISTVLDFIKINDNQRIRDARWYATACFCHDNTAQKLLPLIEVAMEILHKKTEKLTGETVNCISFISLMIKYSPVQTAKILLNPSYQALNAIINIVTQFSSSTSLHFAFRSFVMNSIRNGLLMPTIVSFYVPFFMNEIHKKQKENKNEENNQTNLEEESKNENENEENNQTNLEEEESKNDNDNDNSTEKYQGGLFYITCWNLLMKIDDYSFFSQSLPKNSKKKEPEETQSPKKSRSSLLSYFSSKFKKNQKDDADIIESNDKTKSVPIVKANDIRNELLKIAGFEQFVRNELQPHTKLIDSQYGGSLPLFIADQSPVFVKS